jgi:hypothetical protein
MLFRSQRSIENSACIKINKTNTIYNGHGTPWIPHFRRQWGLSDQGRGNQKYEVNAQRIAGAKLEHNIKAGAEKKQDRPRYKLNTQQNATKNDHSEFRRIPPTSQNHPHQ